MSFWHVGSWTNVSAYQGPHRSSVVVFILNFAGTWFPRFCLQWLPGLFCGPFDLRVARSAKNVLGLYLVLIFKWCFLDAEANVQILSMEDLRGEPIHCFHSTQATLVFWQFNRCIAVWKWWRVPSTVRTQSYLHLIVLRCHHGFPLTFLALRRALLLLDACMQKHAVSHTAWRRRCAAMFWLAATAVSRLFRLHDANHVFIATSDAASAARKDVLHPHTFFPQVCLLLVRVILQSPRSVGQTHGGMWTLPWVLVVSGRLFFIFPFGCHLVSESTLTVLLFSKEFFSHKSLVWSLSAVVLQCAAHDPGDRHTMYFDCLCKWGFSKCEVGSSNCQCYCVCGCPDVHFILLF